MCQTFSEVSGRMQQEQQQEPQQQHRRAADGDLGAIVRSASSSRPDKQLPSPSTSHSSTNLGGFMELISGSCASSASTAGAAASPLPASAPLPTGFLDDFQHPNSFLDSLADIVKREPVDGSEMMHDIFSQSRTPMFLASEDIKAAGFEGLFQHHQQQQQQQQHHQHHQHHKHQETATPAFQQLHELGAIGRLDLGADSSSPRSVKEEVSGSGANNSGNLGGSSSSSSSKAAGSKRSRKMQQKRVVLWPTSGNGKPTGDVLPSDNWAWRKYGQKPIKGSPYPRGYYRCSSSKGCSARKQVERSRNDPSTLVITYTSEHNHPWPAHRNSLAGTTRIRPIVQQQQQQQERQQQQAAEAGGMEPLANPFVSIVNSPSTSEPMQVALDARGTYTPPLLSGGGGGGGDVLVGGGGSLSSSPEEDFFSELEELPELSTILDKSFLEHNKSEEGGGGGGGAAPPPPDSGGAASLFAWSSTSQQRPQH